MSSSEKFDEARKKIKLLRENLRMRALSRETPFLDLLTSKLNGSSLHTQKEDPRIFAAIEELQRQKEDLLKSNKELQAELDERKRERFAVRVG